MERVVNNTGRKLDHQRKTHPNRSTTHIRLKKKDEFDLERMAKHHCKTYGQAVRKLLDGAGGAR